LHIVLPRFLGAIRAKTGGANILRPTIRVTCWGAFAPALTAGIGKLFDLKLWLSRFCACNLVWLRSGSRPFL